MNPGWIHIEEGLIYLIDLVVDNFFSQSKYNRLLVASEFFKNIGVSQTSHNRRAVFL